MALTSGNPKVRKKEPPPPPLPPLKRLRPPVREEEEERFPYGLPRVPPVSGEEEEAGVDLPLHKELCTWETTSERSPESNNPEDDPGEVVRERFWDSGTGRVVWASKLSRGLARMKSQSLQQQNTPGVTRQQRLKRGPC